MDRVLNREQKEAIEFGESPLLIIAGAGTGKTTVITERIKHLLLSQKVKPHEILALTFTEKAAFEMTERVDKIMPYGYSQMWISTFHSFCDLFLRENAIDKGLNPNFRLMTEADSILFLKKNLFMLDLDYFRPLGNPKKFLEAILQHFSRLQDEDITPIEHLKFAESLKKGATGEEEKKEGKKTYELAKAYQAYSKLKDVEGVMDFSDLIGQTLSLLRERPNILKKYQEQFKYILVDEFQDTNFAQNELAILLAGSKHNITVVADDDQAIYRWRGAALSNVIQFKNNFPGAKIITLTKNYRSTQEILDKSYELIQHNNPNRLEKLENINKKLVSQRKIKGRKIEALIAGRVDEEADLIAKKIVELIKGEKYNYSDFAILVRANNHAQPIASALQRHNIPFQFLGPGQLFQQEEIRDLIAYLKVLYDLSDSVALYRVLNIDVFNVEARDINVLLSEGRKKGLTLFESLEKANELSIEQKSKDKLGKIKDLILYHLEKTKKEGAGQILYYFLTETGLFKKLTEIKSEKDEHVAVNIAKLFDKLKTYESVNKNSTIYDTVEWIDLMMEMGESPLVGENDWRNVNAVNILTIHSSKGLEFPVVFMVNLVEDRFPTRERKEKIPLPSKLIKEIIPEGDYHMEEERRLFYVGMTRAKDILFLTAAKFYAEGKREKKISPFVFEVLPEILDKKAGKQEVKQLSLLEIIKDYEQGKVNEVVRKANGIQIYSLSYSQLQAFDVCPLHYKARFILKLPTPATAPLSFGISIHNTFKDFYQGWKSGKNLSLEDFNLLLRKDWISEGYQEKAYEEKMFKKGENLVKNYYENFFDKNNLPLSLESPFSFFLTNKEKKKSIKIMGKIDRIDKLSSSKIEIIDYKTGQSETLSKNSYKLQLGIYALAATLVDDINLNKKPEEIIVTLFYLEEGKKVTNEINSELLEEIKQKILDKVEEIEKSDFKCSKSILCQNCEYKMLCNYNG